MHKTRVLLLLSTGCLLSFLGWYVVLADWVQALQTGVYEQNGLTIGLTSLAILLYTGFAIYFITHKIQL